MLYRYDNADTIRPATPEELAASEAAAALDGGRGVITVEIDGVPTDCYAL